MIHEKPTLTISEFCYEHNIGRTTFYALLNEGKGPKIMKIGRRTIISKEAAKKWREENTHSVATQVINIKKGI